MSKPQTILAIDDDLGQLILAEEVFVADGYNVDTATSGQEALTILRSKNADVILLDIMMPGMDGYETCRQIKQIPGHRHTPVIVLTGRDDIEAIEKSFDSGAWDFTSKPLNWSVLKYRVKYALAASKAFASERQAARLSRIVDNSISEIMVFDVASKAILGANQSALKNLGYQEAELTQRAFTDVVRHQSVSEFNQSLEQLKENDHLKLKAMMTRKDGTEYPVEGVVVFSTDEKPNVYASILQDVTEQTKAEERLHYLAFHDELTGLANRRMLKERVTETLMESDKNGSLCAFFMLDLDGFKKINDTLGHTIGDKLLQEVAERLRSVLRETDIVYQKPPQDSPAVTTDVARFGGDEFIVYVSQFYDQSIPEKIAQRLLAALSMPYAIDQKRLSITASIGIAVYPSHGSSMESLMMSADSAMYLAKESGKNAFRIC